MRLSHSPPLAAEAWRTRRTVRALTLMEVLIFLAIFSGSMLVCLKALATARETATRNAVGAALTGAAQTALAETRSRIRAGEEALRTGDAATDSTITLALGITSAPGAPELRVHRRIEVRAVRENLFEITAKCETRLPHESLRSVTLATRVYVPPDEARP